MRCIELDDAPQDASILMLRACMQVPHLAEVLCGGSGRLQSGESFLGDAAGPRLITWSPAVVREWQQWKGGTEIGAICQL